jgi:ABC-type nitrate/sulfonate/bicarbonate transport system substrate-binding protein
VTTDSFVKKNSDVTRRAVKSIVEAIHVIKTNPELTKRTIRKYMRLKENRDVDEAYQIIRDVSQRKPYPSSEGLKAVLDELAVRMPAAKTANLKDFVDVRFIEELDRSGYIDRLYQ